MRGLGKSEYYIRQATTQLTPLYPDNHSVLHCSMPYKPFNPYSQTAFPRGRQEGRQAGHGKEA